MAATSEEKGHVAYTVQVPEHAAPLLEELNADLDARDPQVLRTWPFSRYIRNLDRYPETASLGFLSPQVSEACTGIQVRIGDTGLERYHRALLLELIVQAPDRLADRGLPDEILRLFERDFARIVSHVASTIDQSELYRYPLSPFFKDLAICALRLIPTGVAKVHPSRLPRRMFIATGVRGAIDAARFLSRGHRGLKPYYYGHVHSQDEQALRDFNLRGWMESWVRLAALLRSNPRIKGSMGVGWLCDPALVKISPHLAYIHTIPIENGGAMFSLGPCGPEGIRDATNKSETRRRLYEQGEYTPTDYVVIWPRKAVIAWADRAIQMGMDALEVTEAPRFAARPRPQTDGAAPQTTPAPLDRATP